MINIKHFEFNELAVNTYILYKANKCIIIDPACKTKAEKESLASFISTNKLEPGLIINTHAHFDHIAGNKFAKDIYSCPLLLHKSDLKLLHFAKNHADLFGLEVEPSPEPDMFIEDEEQIEYGNMKFTVYHVPGHSPGSICLYSETGKFVISGDVLFNGSIGRTDFPEGSYDDLITNIKNKLMVLPPETVVYPGHGTHTTIAKENDNNPFLNY